MNKYKSILSFFTVLVLLAFQSCDLDRFPKDKIALDQSLLTIEDASSWNTGILASLRTGLYGNFSVLSDVQADYLNATASFGNRMGAPHGWIDFKSTDYDIRNTWSDYYIRLKNINYFLNNVPELLSKLSSEKDKSLLGVFMGNAYFARAYYYTNLAVRYGKAYDPATASQDLSVVLLLAYDIAAMPARSTNAEVYAQILSDIAKAEEYLAGVDGKAQSETITIDAVKALKARVKLYMQDWSGAKEVATSLIASGKYPLASPEVDSFKDMWRNDNSSEFIFQMFVSTPDEEPRGHGIYVSPDVKSHVVRPDFIPTQGILDLYEDTDLRKAVYFTDEEVAEFEGQTFPSDQSDRKVFIVTKFWGNPAFGKTDDPKWGKVPISIHKPKVFRIAEMYLIASEASYKAGDEASAVNYLNQLRQSRGLKPIQASGNSLFDEIKNERTRELAFEGFRLWDLKRWNMPMKRMKPQMITDDYSHLASGTTGNPFYKLEIPAGHDKFVWAIPSQDVKINKNIVQNPGW